MTILFNLLLAGCLLWLVASVWRISPSWAVATLLCWPLAAVPMVSHWDDEDHDLRKPYFATLFVGLVWAWLFYASLTGMAEDWQPREQGLLLQGLTTLLA